MTIAQRRLLEKFAGGDTALCRAIAAALHDLDRARAERPCGACGGTGRRMTGVTPPLECGRCEGDGRARP